MHSTEKEKLFLATKGFNNNLVHFVPLYHIVSNVSVLLWVWFSLCTSIHLKLFCMHKILCTKNCNVWSSNVSWEGQHPKAGYTSCLDFVLVIFFKLEKNIWVKIQPFWILLFRFFCELIDAVQSRASKQPSMVENIIAMKE